MMQADFFKGLKVVELASVLAGPSVGLFFAELGAEVLKVENKTTGGDVTRRWKLPGEPSDSLFSAYYASVNYGKTSILLDLSLEEERAEVLRLSADADVLISNFRAASAHRLGLDYRALAQLNPRLIYAQVNGFGALDARPAFDVVLQAEAGFLYMNGEDGRPPVKMPVALIDLLAAHQLKEGILLALLRRQSTGKGSLVETSLLEAALASLANQSTNWLMGGVIPERMGTLHPNIAPYGELFRCRDGKEIVLAVGTESQFRALCGLLGRPEWAEDARFSVNSARVTHRSTLNELLSTALEDWNSVELAQACHREDIPVGIVRNMKEVFENPIARAMIQHWNLPDGTPAQSVRSVAFRLLDMPVSGPDLEV